MNRLYVIRPSTTVTHSAPGPLATRGDAVSYITSARSRRHVRLIEAPDEPALGLGEVGMGPTVAAIGNAVARALGTRIRNLPLTRERIMATLLAEQ